MTAPTGDELIAIAIEMLERHRAEQRALFLRFARAGQKALAEASLKTAGRGTADQIAIIRSSRRSSRATAISTPEIPSYLYESKE